jgi:hypothetical protein
MTTSRGWSIKLILLNKKLKWQELQLMMSLVFLVCLAGETIIGEMKPG